MNQILMAAARGARIQYRHHLYGEWVDTWYVSLHPDATETNNRIHPDDEHLRFGPISSALREYAETGREPYTLVGLMAREAMIYEQPYPFVLKSEWDHAQMFALILSEALASEGL